MTMSYSTPKIQNSYQNHNDFDSLQGNFYPPGPADVPNGLTRPNAHYRRQARIAVGTLLLFFLVYLGLACWFVQKSIRTLLTLFEGRTEHEFTFMLVGVSCGLLSIFMLKGLFFVNHGGESSNTEVKAETQPALFDFLHRLADEAGSPRPHRVFLSPQVNAAVFYDLSLLNLLIPTRKNLVIGLPLVNVLTLSEFKSVLAHEFGHFAQRSMAVGSWVYIAKQVAMALVVRRDWLDKLLRNVSYMDLRVAWIGWFLRLVIWSVRSLFDSLLSLVVLAQRALSRQMEFQADLVAVSLTGSDELIHALHKLKAADEAWQQTTGFIASQLRKGQVPKDVFSAHTLIRTKLGQIKGDTWWGDIPPVGDEAPAQRRLFKQGLTQPPQMWSTHPTSADREVNAKNLYVDAPHDSRSSWQLFADRDGLLAKMRSLLSGEAKDHQLLDIDETTNEVELHFSSPRLDPIYRGAYLQRELTRHARNVTELLEPAEAGAIQDEQALYPESLQVDIEQLRELEEELAVLHALSRNAYEANGRRFVFRGREIKRRDLPSAIETVQEDLEANRERLRDHDRRCRGAGLAAAEKVGLGWPESLRGLVTLLHYAEHARADLTDVARVLDNVVMVITADGSISGRELERLISACNQLHSVLQLVHGMAPEVKPDPFVLKRLGVDSWSGAIGEFCLPPANAENINDWMDVQADWVNGALAALNCLVNATLEQILISEASLYAMVRREAPVKEAPVTSFVRGDYALLLEGSERPKQWKLGWWDRFLTADGLVPGLARVTLALCIVGSVICAAVSLDF